MKLSKWLMPFIWVSVIHLFAHAADLDFLDQLTKPLLMPMLALYFWKSCISTPLNNFVFAALFFSWLGDTLLIFAYYNELFFIAGLIAFLIAHITYVLMNLNFVNDGNSRLVFKWPALFFILYGVLVFSQLLESLGALTIPVAIYTSVICIMGITAFGRINRTGNLDYRFVVGGAGLFIVSDTLLAFNKFNAPIGSAGLWVMLTYLIGQFLLIEGYKRFILDLKK